MRRRLAIGPIAVCLILGASSAFALTSGTDVLVPAAARGAGQAGSMWITDLNVLNVAGETASVEVFWLSRNQPNPSPPSAVFSVSPGSALVLSDVISEVFGLDSAGGAFRVVADASVVVACRIYNLQGSATFGQGFEGVPRLAAIAAGEATDVVGLRADSSFRTNVVLIDASDRPVGSTVELSLRDAGGMEIASQTIDLRRFEPLLFPVTDIGASSFEYATLHAEVTSGSVIVAASKVDNDPNTGDPTTLEAWMAGATADGTYEFSIYDSLLFAAGGNLVVEDGEVQSLTGTYFNWDKLDNGEPACTLLFAWGGVVSPPIPLADFSSGVEFETAYPDGGEMVYTLTFDANDPSAFAGTIDAVGSGFTGIDSGCNGSFPELELVGGKSE